MATNMDVDTPGSGVMAAPGTSGSVTVSLHPLVIMNISEHWTRTRAQEGKLVQGKFSKIYTVQPQSRLINARQCSNYILVQF